MIKNKKLIEFIFKNEYFYYSLSDKNRKLISDLEQYSKDLTLYEISEEKPYIYLYIGYKEHKNYFCKCNYKYDNKVLKFDIKNSEIITILDLSKYLISDQVRIYE